MRILVIANFINLTRIFSFRFSPKPIILIQLVLGIQFSEVLWEEQKKLGIRWPDLVLTSASQCLPAEHHIPLNSESATCGVSRVLRTVCTVGKVEGRDRR